MAKLIPCLMMVAMVFLSGTVSSDEITVTGTLIDTKCYGMNHDNTENEHTVPMKDGSMGKMPNCATACAQMGIPVGLLEKGKKDGKVYIIVAPAGQLAEHAAKDARITGDLAYPGGILPKKIEVKNDDGTWEEVQIATMM